MFDKDNCRTTLILEINMWQSPSIYTANLLRRHLDSHFFLIFLLSKRENLLVSRDNFIEIKMNFSGALDSCFCKVKLSRDRREEIERRWKEGSGGGESDETNYLIKAIRCTVSKPGFPPPCRGNPLPANWGAPPV